MIYLNNTFNLNDLSLFKDTTGEYITIPFSPLYISTYNKSPSAFAGYNKFSLSCNDDLQINLKIINSTSDDIELIKLKFTNDTLFELVPCSVINTDTLDAYYCESLEQNLISMTSLKTSSELNIKFNVKINFSNLNERYINSIIQFFPYEKYNSLTSNKNYLIFNQSLLKITTAPDSNLITFENSGTSPIENTIFKYNIPLSYDVKLESLNATFNNNKWELIAEKSHSNIIFKIPYLPPSNNLPSRKLNIFLKHDKFNIHLCNGSSNLSIDNK